MGGRKAGNWLVVALLILNCLALWGIVAVWWGENEALNAPQPLKTTEIPVAPMLRNQQSLSEFRVVAAKNLFSQDRTGPDVGSTDPQRGRGSLEGKVLLGTMIINNQRVALIGGAPLRKPKDSAAEAVRLGEQWDGYKVIEITRDSVVFLGRNGKTTLQFPE
jgi:hypothetical protein